MYIRLHVYSDGDTELLKVASKETDDLYYDELYEMDNLKKELQSYGCWEDSTIDEAINEVKMSGEFDPILVKGA
jgi:hypothetical protein